MQTPQTEIYHETVVLPLFEIVIFPDSRTKFNVSKATGELLLATLKNGGAARAVGLTVKSGTRLSEVTTESMYRTGNLFRIPRVEPADDGYLVCAQVVKRVRATAVTEKDGQFYATFEPVPDILDIEPDLKGRILADIKLTIHETSSRFSGSEQFTKPIDQMDSADQIMGFVMPFLPVPIAEKQALLEIISVRQRYITFLELLIRVRENISIRMEMAKKVSDKVGKSNREAILREQLEADPGRAQRERRRYRRRQLPGKDRGKEDARRCPEEGARGGTET